MLHDSEKSGQSNHGTQHTPHLSLNAFVDFSPYYFQTKGFSEQTANQMASMVSICYLTFGPVAGMLFSKYHAFRSQLFFIAGALTLLSFILALIFAPPSTAFGFAQMILLGVCVCVCVCVCMCECDELAGKDHE